MLRLGEKEDRVLHCCQAREQPEFKVKELEDIILAFNLQETE